MSPDDEQQLLAKCRQGDAEAWDGLFDLHYAATGRFVFQLGYGFNREDIEEICQETFLTVVRSLAGFQGNSRFQTWLFRIAANKARDFRQKQNALKRGGNDVTVPLQQEDPVHGTVIDPPNHRAGPDGLMVRQENLDMLGEALRTLSDPCREIIELRYFGDLSYEELARALELNPKTVSSRLSKCLDKLELVTKCMLDRENKSPTSV